MTLRASPHWYHLLQVLLVVSFALMAACSSPSPKAKPNALLALLFDIPAPGKAPSMEPEPRLPRRVVPDAGGGLVLSTGYIAMQEALAKAGPPPNWPEIYKKLPRDDEDNIVWAKALESKLINPAAGIDEKTPQPKPMDLDVEISTSGKPDRMVVFPHKIHTQWLVCDNCHPAIFEQEAGAAKITMKAIDDGKYCGVCHDKVALAPDGCNGCHKPIKKS